MKYPAMMIFTFILSFVLGCIIVESKKSLLVNKFANIEVAVQGDSNFKIAQRVYRSTELGNQSYTTTMLPEAKKSILTKNPELLDEFESEDFWKRFKKENSEQLQILNSDHFDNMANSLIDLNKVELLEFLNLQESSEVKTVQEKIKLYMQDDFLKDNQRFQLRLEKLIYNYYNKKLNK